MVAAELASRLGVRVACAERGRPGGDCLWTGCVPSKALLASAKAAHTIRHSDAYGLEAVGPSADTGPAWTRIKAIQEGLAAGDDDPERFRRAGVDVLLGSPARLISPTTVRAGRQHAARFVLLATGSRPALPAIEGLRAATPLTNETIFALDRAPASIVLIGGGPVGVELAQGLNRLGVRVTLLQRGPRILAREEPELAARLVERLRHEGVEVVTSVDADRVTVAADGAKTVAAGERSWSAAEILVAAGRMPNVEGLGLEEVGVKVGARGVVVDDALRTSVRSIYAAGDVAGRALFTHAAGFEAARAVRNMFFPGTSRGSYLVPWCTFTDPELARAGPTEAQARALHGERAVRVWRRDLARSDRAHAESAAGDGELRIITAKGRVVGAHVLAPGAGELIGELALAIERKLKLTDLASVVHVYPTIALAIQQIAAEASYAAAERYRWLVRSRA